MRRSTRAVARPQVGNVVAFPGTVRHGGARISSGVRYIVAAFLWIDVEGFELPAGWA